MGLAKTRDYLLGLAGIATDLGKKQIDAKGGILVGQVLLEFRDLLAKHVGGVADTANDAHSTGVGNCSSQLRTSSNIHTSEQDGVLDLEKIRDGGSNLLCTPHTPWSVLKL